MKAKTETECPEELSKLAETIGPKLAKLAAGRSFSVNVRRSLGGWLMDIRAADIPDDRTFLAWMNAKRRVHFLLHGEDCNGGILKAELLQRSGPEARGKTGSIEQMERHLLKAAAAVFSE